MIDLGPFAKEWNVTLPPRAVAGDYALSKGANAALHRDGERVPLPVRGVFGVLPSASSPAVRLADVTDGTSHTFAIGEAAGGSSMYLARDPDTGQAAISTITGGPIPIDQSWSAASIVAAGHPWFGSAFAVTAQYGLAPDFRDEPMNRRPCSPSYWGNDNAGDNRSGKDMVSGFRSLHPGGCNFLFCDGSVRFVRQTILPEVYRALSTRAGGEVVAGE
jgi:prepilin-type processing-associated H-X9-DG protein